MSTEISGQIADYAQWTGKNVKVMTAWTYDKVSDTVGYITDTEGHAVHSLLGRVELLHASNSVLSIPIDIPPGSNALAFGYEFLYGESGSMLEVFINDVPVFHMTSDIALGGGLNLTPWVNVEPFAGQSATLTLRISNPNPDTEGKIRIDDLVIAKIEDAKAEFPWFMFLPAMTAGKQ